VGADVDKEEKKMMAEMQPFTELIEKRTKLNAQFHVIRGMPSLIKNFQDRKIQMAVMHCWEYGWLRAKVENCRPLIAAVQDTLTLKAEVLVRNDCTAKSLADLKGQRLAVPERPQAHVIFFVERAVGHNVEKYFQKQEVKNTDDAIEAVIDGTAQTTVVGNAALDVYRERKPGRFKRLRVLEESMAFPPTVIVYSVFESNDETMKTFRESLFSADQTAEGRQTLNLWRISGFQDPPKEYDAQVAEVIKRYPMDVK
jgi:ABC-type phosphate/phosphonate transport system substrate-binding protein